MGYESVLSPRSTLFMISAPDMLDEDAQTYPIKRTSQTLLHQVLDDKATKGKTILYTYDYGDNWEHVMICGGRAEPTTTFVVIGGEGRGCAENVGGYSGWTNLIQAYESDKPTQDQQELMTWFEEKAEKTDPSGVFLNPNASGLRGAEKYMWDKDSKNKILEELDTSKLPSNGSSILVISLARRSWFDNMFDAMLAKLRSKTLLKEVTHISSAMKCLEGSPIQKFATIIVTDHAIMEQEFAAVNKKLIEYTKSGGTVVFGLMMPNLASPPIFDRFFEDGIGGSGWGLNWKFGTYSRETYNANNQSHLASKFQGKLDPYNTKAVSLLNAKPEDRVYLNEENQSPVIFAKYGNSETKQGYVGWLGDVNAEQETATLLLAMCGF